MRTISVVNACYNEEENVREVYRQVKEVFSRLPGYQYEQIFIDNASTDRTVDILKEIARQDKRVKIIVNSRDFGPSRSSYYVLLQASGDAMINMVTDLQDPPTLIPELIKKWEEGCKVVLAVKKPVKENPLMFAARQLFYKLICFLSEVEQTPNFSGFCLLDKRIIEILRKLEAPDPYFRGLISDLGFDYAKVEFEQPPRRRGKSKCNLYLLYHVAMLGITSHSKIPLRLATFIGFLASLVSLLIALGYFVYKLIFWNSFDLGMAPLVVGLFFFSAVQLFFIGIIGEYVGAIHTQVLKRPLVIEKERINF
ncbi:MAG: glycosyltransferase family 2 protein [Candidatus Saganbacteria bacterium]|nr:glycosyltransferase family 2 protein [Candidatus Saganbacteria bacterium]